MVSGGGKDRVKLNIGGIHFHTNKSTLTKVDGFFKTMLETDIPLEKDDHGAIFIDRSPKHFELILNYMRDGFVIIPDSKAATQEIQTEAQYYLLDGLVKLCSTENPVTNKTKDYCLETEKDLINAVMSCTKKAVIVMLYETGNGLQEIMDVPQDSKFLMKYSANFHVYFYPYEPAFPNCRVFDVSTGHFCYVSRHKLDNFLKENYGVE